MNAISISLICILALVCTWMYQRARAPDLLNEVYNGLMHLSYKESQTGSPIKAERYKDMANALFEGQAYVQNKPICDLDHLRVVSRHVLESMDYSVLEGCGIYRQNHKHACYKAIGNLAEKLEQIIRSQK